MPESSASGSVAGSSIPVEEKKAFGRIFPLGTRRRRFVRWAIVTFFPPGGRRRRFLEKTVRGVFALIAVTRNRVTAVIVEVRYATIRIRMEWLRQRADIDNRDGDLGFVRYKDWSSRLPPDQETLTAQRRLFASWPRPPTIRVVVVDGKGALADTCESLAEQTWGLVEVTIVSPGGLVQELRRLRDGHPGDLVILLRAGDQLRADTAYEAAQAAWRDPLLELVYWDDDLAKVAGVWKWFSAGQPRRVYSRRQLRKLGNPRIKPGWSPDLLTCANYIGRSFALRARYFDAELAGQHARNGLDDDSLWWESLLGLDLCAEQVIRLPMVLQALAGRNEQVESRHLEMVDRRLARLGWPARAELGPNCVYLEWGDENVVPVSVIIPTRHNRELLTGAFDLIRSANWPDLDLIIVDNGGRSEENEAWYADQAGDLDPTIIWWEEPFNYSAANNRGAAAASGEVLVFLNDDTASEHPGWLANLCGWALRPEIGVVGLQLMDGDGLIQHGGVILGMHGFADHLFQGMPPHSNSLIGSTDWTRNAVAATGACLAVRRSVFEQVGGFDERLVLCGSDVVLGLKAIQAGFRNVVSAATPVKHLESATRGPGSDPAEDVFTSYWFYQRWLMGGDPFWSPSLSADFPRPSMKYRTELTILERLTRILKRPMEVFHQRNDAAEAHTWALISEADRDLPEVVAEGHRAIQGFRPVTSINWFVPEFQSPFYGGIHTVFRLADHLATHHGVENRFMVMTGPANHDERWYRSGISVAFPSMADCPVVYHNSFDFDPEAVPSADIAMATMWTTAYFAAQTPGQDRRFYLIQDYEPMFHPAGTLYGLAEHSYRLGLYGLCNTGHLADIYRDRYGGVADCFWPAVDGQIFHDHDRPAPDPDRPVTVFLYARPGHLRNCWELAARALRLVKTHLADDVRIITAGSWTPPDDLEAELVHLGQLDYHETGPLYRACDIGVALTVSEHPSYLPLELMACGTAVVALDNPAGDWLLQDDHNCVRAPMTSMGLADEIISLAEDPARRQRLAKQGRADIAARYGNWERNLAGVYAYLCDPESRR